MSKTTAKLAIVTRDPVDGKYYAKYDDKVVVRGNSAKYVVENILERRGEKVRKLGLTGVKCMENGAEVPVERFIQPQNAVTVPNGSGAPLENTILDELAAKYDINERFDMMYDLIGLVINKIAPSLIISGPGGLGKSHSVMHQLKKRKLKEVSWVQPAADINPESDDTPEELEEKIMKASVKSGDYAVVKGFSSPKNLYRTLFECQDKTIVFDDCDSIMRFPDALNLLKSALDTSRVRTVHWGSEPLGGDDLPKQFEFTGSIIFISNLPVSKIDQALRTRAYVIDLQMTQDQRMKRMETVITDVADENDIELYMMKEAFKFLDANKEKARDLNFRTLINVAKIRKGSTEFKHVKSWEKLAEYAISCMQ